MKYRAIFLIFVILKPCFADAEDFQKISLDYDIQWGNLIIGYMHITLKKNNKLITLEAKAQSSKAISLLYEYKSHLMATSYKEGKNWKAGSYILRSNMKNRYYSTIMHWNKRTGKVNYKIDPPLDLEKVYSIPNSSLKDVIDPVTSLMRVIAKINSNKSCATALSIFDGRRRYNLFTKALGKRYITNDRPISFRGNVVVCGVKITPIGGHWKESKWDAGQDKFSDIKIFFGINGTDSHYPVRLELDRWFGIITFRLLKTRPGL